MCRVLVRDLAGDARVVHHELMASPPRAADRGRVTAAAVAAAVALAVLGSAVAASFDRGTAMFADTLSFGFVVAVIAVVGATVTLAVPGNRVGRLLLTAAAVLGVGTAFTEAGIHGVVTVPGSVPGAAYLAALGPGLQAAGMVVAVVWVPAVFPDGHLPGPRWRWLAWPAAAAAACLFLANVLSPTSNENRLARWHSPLGLTGRYVPVAGALAVAGILLAVGAAGGAVAGLVTRWRRGGPRVRQQLLFLALAACPPALVFLAILTNISLPGWIFGVVLLPLPVAIAVAILHRGLYDLRRAAHRTLVWLTMSAAVVGIYAAVVITVAALVPDHHAWWPPALAAALAALALIPLRDKLQRGVTRVVYGRWHEPYEVLAGLGERLEAAADIDRLLEAAVAELTTGLDLHDVSVRDLDGTVVTGTGGTVAGAAAAAVPGGAVAVLPGTTGGTGPGTASIPLLAYGTTVGSLTYRVPARPLSAAEERLLHDLARQLGGALHARLLREDLQRARERLVLAREEERRRLRRDLHDGIGPALAGLTLKTETARALLPPGSDSASRQLHDLGEEIRRTVVDVRRLVEGLRPPALDELGLAGACAQAVERLTAGAGLVASVDARDDLAPLPAAVEVAAYRIVVEAVTNTVRHARARHCRVSMTLTPAGLAVEVTDDGTGLVAAGHHGHGLAIMRERAEELGGTVIVRDDSPGVTVEARLPAVTAPAQVTRVPAVPA
jgi:signal transduction histidine kinase